VTGRHSCTLCDWSTAEPVKKVAEARSVWHVYRDHPQTWLDLAGDRPPEDPDPDTAGGYAILATMAGLN
jgi:hypothetical protein